MMNEPRRLQMKKQLSFADLEKIAEYMRENLAEPKSKTDDESYYLYSINPKTTKRLVKDLRKAGFQVKPR